MDDTTQTKSIGNDEDNRGAVVLVIVIVVTMMMMMMMMMKKKKKKAMIYTKQPSKLRAKDKPKQITREKIRSR